MMQISMSITKKPTLVAVLTSEDDISTLEFLLIQYRPQSTPSAGPVRFLIFCSVSLVAGRRPQCTVAENVLYPTYPLEFQIPSSQPRQKSCWASSLRI
jgi:hypothetical protein